MRGKTAKLIRRFSKKTNIPKLKLKYREATHEGLRFYALEIMNACYPDKT